MKKILISIIILITIISCNSKMENKAIWMIKTPMDVQYIYSIKDNIYCWGYEKGYFKINKDGKILKKEIFDKDDKRRTVINIKSIHGVGVYAYMGNIKPRQFFIELKKEDWKWIVAIKEDGKYEKFVDIPKYFAMTEEFLISPDKKKYCIFEPMLIDNDKKLPYLWLDKEIWIDEKKGKNFYKDLMKEYKTGNKEKQFESFSKPDKIYFIDKKYYDFGWYIYNNEGVMIKKNLDNNYNIKTGKEFYRLSQFNNNYYYLNDFIYGDDNYFYIIYQKPKDSKYYVIKADKDLNLVGKRLTKAIKNVDGRCVTGIYVDSQGYVYVISDTDKTVVKQAPIEKGEDSYIDLRKMKVKE